MKHVLSTLALAASALMATGSAVAVPEFFEAIADGASEAPPTPSLGTSTSFYVIDADTLQMNASVPFQGLIAPTTAAHIHCCTAAPFSGNAAISIGMPDFPLGVTAGTYSHAFDLSDATIYDAAFLSSNGGTAASAAAALLAGIAANQAYLNIHTSLYPAGEIRGFLVTTPIPEPASWAMLGIGLAGLGFMRRRVGKG